MKKLLLSFVILISLNAQAQTFNFTAGPVGIPDNGTWVDVPLTVSGLPSSINSSFGLSQMCLDINHTYDSDLEVHLISTTGTNIVLFSGIGFFADNFTGTCLSENGANGYIVNAVAPFTGNYIPVNSLNNFNDNQNPNGTWYLRVIDTYPFADSGWVNTFSVTFSANPPPDPAPPPHLCTFCTCPGGAASCDLLPDMTSSANCIQGSYYEVPGYLNFDNATPNIGWGPLEIHGVDTCFCDSIPVPCTISGCPSGSPVMQKNHQVIYQRQNNSDTLTSYTRPAGMMSYHQGHGHIHVDHWADFSIRTATANPDATTWPIVGVGTKQSFCLVNLGDCTGNYGYCVDTNGVVVTQATAPNNGFGFVTGCGLEQGIYPGSLDIYVAALNDPVNLAGVCNGNYYIVSITDPANNMLEITDANNWAAVPIQLTQQAVAPSANYSEIVQSPSTRQFTASNLAGASTYSWNFGDGNSASNINPVTHTYATSGTYTVHLTVNSSCGIFTDSSQVIITLVGVTQVDRPQFSFTVNPNPAKDQLKISFSLQQNQNVTLSVFDLAGKKVATLIDSKLDAGANEIRFNTSDVLAQGVYVFRLQANEASEEIKVTVVK